MEDESFDSFKRRHIEQVKSNTNSAAPNSSKSDKNVPIAPPVSPKTSFAKIKSQSRSSSKFRWEERLEEAFGTIGHHEYSDIAGKPTSSPSQRQLDMRISDGIRSPILVNTTTSNKERGILEEKVGGDKSKVLRRAAFKFGNSNSESSHSRKPTRIRRYNNRCSLWKELLELEGKGRRIPPPDHQESHSDLQPVSKNDNERLKRAVKKPKKLVPLSDLLLSAKEYYNLSILTPVALEREERYNWGHIKKNARVRNKIMRSKIRVL